MESFDVYAFYSESAHVQNGIWKLLNIQKWRKSLSQIYLSKTVPIVVSNDSST